MIAVAIVSYLIIGLYVGWRQWLWCAPHSRPALDAFMCFVATPLLWPVFVVLHSIISRILRVPHLAPKWFGKVSP